MPERLLRTSRHSRSQIRPRRSCEWARRWEQTIGAENVLRRLQVWNQNRAESSRSGAEVDQSDYRIQTSLGVDGTRFLSSYGLCGPEVEVGGAKLVCCGCQVPSTTGASYAGTGQAHIGHIGGWQPCFS